MKSPYEQLALEMLGGVVQSQRLVVPSQVVMRLPSYRAACRFAWKLCKLKHRPNLTYQLLADLTGLYAPHVGNYFARDDATPSGKPRRELPARSIAAVEGVFGNTVISQYQAQQSKLTVLEELQLLRRAGAA